MPDYASQLEQQAAFVIPTVPTTGEGRLDGPELLALFGIVASALRAFQSVVGGASFRLETRAPGPADGEDEDAWLNGATGDLYKKESGAWSLRGNVKGPKGNDSTVPGPKGNDSTVPGPAGKSTYQLWLEAGNTGNLTAFLAAQKGADGEDGEDGADGTTNHVHNYDPAATDGNDGDLWTTAVSLTTERRFQKVAGTWRKYYDNTVVVANAAPVVSFNAPAAGATVTKDQLLTLTATVTDDKAGLVVEFLNGATGLLLGTAVKNGTTYTMGYTPTVTGPLSLQVRAIDSDGVPTLVTNNITVQAAPAVSITASYTAVLADYQQKCSVAPPAGYQYPTGTGTGSTQAAADTAAKADAISKIACPVQPATYQVNLAAGETDPQTGILWTAAAGYENSVFRYNRPAEGDTTAIDMTVLVAGVEVGLVNHYAYMVGQPYGFTLNDLNYTGIYANGNSTATQI